jgi:hypothetical protein
MTKEETGSWIAAIAGTVLIGFGTHSIMVAVGVFLIVLSINGHVSNEIQRHVIALIATQK